MIIELTEEEAAVAVEMWNVALKTLGGVKVAQAYLNLCQKVASAQQSKSEPIDPND